MRVSRGCHKTTSLNASLAPWWTSRYTPCHSISHQCRPVSHQQVESSQRQGGAPQHFCLFCSIRKAHRSAHVYARTHTDDPAVIPWIEDASLSANKLKPAVFVAQVGEGGVQVGRRFPSAQRVANQPISRPAERHLSGAGSGRSPAARLRPQYLQHDDDQKGKACKRKKDGPTSHLIHSSVCVCV